MTATNSRFLQSQGCTSGLEGDNWLVKLSFCGLPTRFVAGFINGVITHPDAQLTLIGNWSARLTRPAIAHGKVFSHGDNSEDYIFFWEKK